jgi:ketosteroid isomerase-like protein
MHPNEDLLRREYDAFARDDVASFDGIFADDIVDHVPGHNPFSGDYRGKEAVFELFRQDRRDSFRSEIHDILADDRHAVALTVVQGARQGRVLEDIHGSRRARPRREDHGVVVLPRRPGGKRRVLV